MMEQYRFGLLDPRPGNAAEAGNAPLLGSSTLGIEVTVPALAARCGLGNIDPQHSGNDSSRAAIQDCLDTRVPDRGSTLVTVRPDLDSVGGMAVMMLRANGYDPGPMEKFRVTLIAAADRHARGPWPGPRKLPSSKHPFDCAIDRIEIDLAAIAGAVADRSLTLARRVNMVASWMRSGKEPALYRQRWIAEREAMVAMLEAGHIRVELAADGRVAIVVADRPGMIALGYRCAPVVIALNESFEPGSGDTHRKFTIAQYALGYLDMNGLCRELNEQETGWGGTSTIIGSPQGINSSMTLKRVTSTIVCHLNLPPEPGRELHPAQPCKPLMRASTWWPSGRKPENR